MSDPIPFATPQHWSDWLAANHAIETEVWLLYHKKSSGVPSIDWPQAVVQALAHGWIDGIRKTLNDSQWIQRFTPRKPGSAWSLINIAHAERLIAEGRMTPRGQAAVDIARANGQWDRGYSASNPAELPADFLAALTAANLPVPTSKRARFVICYRLTTAKRPETRQKRIADFIAKLAAGTPLV